MWISSVHKFCPCLYTPEEYNIGIQWVGGWVGVYWSHEDPSWCKAMKTLVHKHPYSLRHVDFLST